MKAYNPMMKTPVIYTLDDNYAMQAAVSLLSLIENNKEKRFHFYILSDGIQQKNKDRLIRLVESHGNEISIIEMPDLENYTGFKYSIDGWAKAAYCRLFLCSLLPQQLERILYLDPDTLVIGDIELLIKELYSKEFDSFFAAACIDCCPTYKRLHGFRKHEFYYNTGIMLINLKKWREHKVERAFIEEIKRRKGQSTDVDQSYINCILINKIKTLPVEYNAMPFYFYDCSSDYDSYIKNSQYRRCEIYNRDELKAARANPKILHFSGYREYRPWYKGCKHIYTGEWYKYLNKTEWESFSPIELPESQKISTTLKIRREIGALLFNIPIIAKLYTRIRFGFSVKVYRRGF